MIERTTLHTRYRGYLAAVYYDTDDHIYYGHLVGINDRIGFQSNTECDIMRHFRDAVDDYLNFCARVGKTPEVPR